MLDIMPLKPAPCPACGKRFDNNHAMASHIAKAHPGGPMSHITIHLPTGLMAWIDAQIDAGLYPNRAEVIRFCLNHVRHTGGEQ